MAYDLNSPAMSQTQSDRPRSTYFACAAVAAGIGVAYLFCGAAPTRYVVVILGSLLVGSLCFLIDPTRWKASTSNLIIIAAGVVLCVVGIWGESSHGASRWLLLGGFSVEPSMILLPFAALMFARKQNAFSALGMILIAIAVAIQPDRSMAGALSCIHSGQIGGTGLYLRLKAIPRLFE